MYELVISPADLEELFEGATRLVAMKGKKVEEFAVGKKTTEEAVTAMLGGKMPAFKRALGRVADIEARRNGLSDRIRDLEHRLDRMTQRTEEIERQRVEVDADQPESTTVDATKHAVASCADAVEAARRLGRHRRDVQDVTPSPRRRHLSRDAVDAITDAASKQGCAGFRVLTAQLL